MHALSRLSVSTALCGVMAAMALGPSGEHALHTLTQRYYRRHTHLIGREPAALRKVGVEATLLVKSLPSSLWRKKRSPERPASLLQYLSPQAPTEPKQYCQQRPRTAPSSRGSSFPRRALLTAISPSPRPTPVPRSANLIGSRGGRGASTRSHSGKSGGRA